MRPLLSLVLLWAASALVACQDSYASNSERDTHMGDVRASAPPPPLSAAAAAPTPAAAAPATANPPPNH